MFKVADKNNFDRYPFMTKGDSNMIRTPAHKQIDPDKKPGQWNYTDNPSMKPSEEFKALEPPVRPVATTTLAGYIQRVVEAEKGLPEYKMVDVSAVHFVMDVLYHKKETLYLAELLKKVLDKAR